MIKLLASRDLSSKIGIIIIVIYNQSLGEFLKLLSLQLLGDFRCLLFSSGCDLQVPVLFGCKSRIDLPISFIGGIIFIILGVFDSVVINLIDRVLDEFLIGNLSDLSLIHI